jgi:hypothetical protein
MHAVAVEFRGVAKNPLRPHRLIAARSSDARWTRCGDDHVSGGPHIGVRDTSTVRRHTGHEGERAMTTTTGAVGGAAGGEAARRGAGLLAATAAITLMVLAATSHGAGAADPFGDCVKEHKANGQSDIKAKAECRLQTLPSAITVKPGGGGLEPSETPSSSTKDSGTSVGLLAAVGLGGLVVGAALMMLLRKRGDASGRGASPAGRGGPPGPGAPGGPMPGYLGVPQPPQQGAAPLLAPPGRPPGTDRSGALVTTLVDLTDRVSSGALRAEIVAALARAGVQSLEPAQGEIFDANRMRGVGSAAAPDPTWIGRVAMTERAGFQDGGASLRLPEVIVYTAEG